MRARRVQVKGDDAIIKLRPVSVAELPPKLRQTEGFGVEVDAMPGGFVCSGTLKRVPKRTDVRTAVTGDAPISALFAKSQRRLVEQGVDLGGEQQTKTRRALEVFAAQLREG